MRNFRIHEGDAMAVLPTLDAESVHCVVTSPPYWGLRDYKLEPSVWGGEPGCGHEWGGDIRRGGPAGAQGSTSQRNGRANVAEQQRQADTLGQREPLSDGPLGGRQRAEMRGEGTEIGKAYDKGKHRRLSAGAGPHRKVQPLQGSHGTTGHDGNGMRMPEKWNNPAGRNPRSVWTIATAPFPEAHFATFPPELVERPILASCPEAGTVLDPFAGAFTTGLVALRLGRNFIGIEANHEYCEMGRRRIHEDAPLLNQESESRLDIEERRAVGIERWAKQEHDRGNRYGMRGVEDALMEQAVIAGMRRNRR